MSEHVGENEQETMPDTPEVEEVTENSESRKLSPVKMIRTL